MKKTISALLALSLTLTLAACGGKKAETPVESTPGQEGIKAPSVCVIVGNASDKSFSESCARGAQLVGEKYGSSYR